MKLPYIIMLFLSAGIAVLEGIKQLFMRKKKPKKRMKEQVNGIKIGSSMTIGDREVQEDNIGTLSTRAGVLAILADGMGKNYGGRIASHIAVETFLDLFKEYNAFDNPQYYFRKSFHCANKEILKALENERRGAASVGAVMIRENQLYYAVVGNVKIFIFREGDLVPVSTGHTIEVLAEERFREGKISRQAALQLLENHRLFNYLGQDGFRDIEFFDKPITLKKGDQVLLMSDGMYEQLDFAGMEPILSSGMDIKKKAFQLVEQINNQIDKKKDNASVILLEIGKDL